MNFHEILANVSMQITYLFFSEVMENFECYVYEKETF